jgi:membrane protein DedA with SNARE-associated domain
MNEFIELFLATIRDMDPVTRTLIAMLGMFLETSVLVGVIVPGDSIALIASMGVTSTPQYFWLIAALIVGALLGETGGFFIGRFFGPKLRASRLGQKLGEKNWMLADLYLGDRGGVAVFVSRFLPVLHSLIPISAGMTRLRVRTVIAWTAPASAIWATLYVSFGYFVAASFDELSGTLRSAGLILVALFIVFVIAMWLIKRRIFKNEISKHEEVVSESLRQRSKRSVKRVLQPNKLNE